MSIDQGEVNQTEERSLQRVSEAANLPDPAARCAGYFDFGETSRHASAHLACLHDGTVGKKRHIVETRAVTHARSSPTAQCMPMKQSRPISTGAMIEIAVFDAIAEHLRFEPDAGVVADGDHVVSAAERRADRDVTADLRAHGAPIEAHQRRADEHIGPGQSAWKRFAIHQRR